MIFCREKIQKSENKSIISMKRNIYIWFVLGMLLGGLSACEMRDELKKLPSKEDQKEEGWMTLDVGAQGKASGVSTRAVFNPEDVDPLLYPVDIVDALTGVVVLHYDSYEALQSRGQVKLTVGRYKVVAYNYDGSEVDASERPFFKGVTEFEVLPGKLTKVNTVCKLQNLAVSIAFTDEFNTEFRDDYAITVTNGESGVQIFKKDKAGKTFYFKVPTQKNSVQLTVKATTVTNNQIAQNYTIKKPADAEGNDFLASGDEFSVNIGPGDSPSVDPTTQVELNITVDLTMHERNVTIEIPTENIVFDGSTQPNPDPDPEPENDITVVGLGQTYTLPLAEGSKVQVNISAPNGITKLVVRIESDNVGFMETLAGFGLREAFDIANPGDLLPILSGSLEDGEGIGLIDANDPIKGKTSYLFDVTDFMTLLTLYGASENTFTLTIEDGQSTPITGVLKVIVPNLD